MSWLFDKLKQSPQIIKELAQKLNKGIPLCNSCCWSPGERFKTQLSTFWPTKPYRFCYWNLDELFCAFSYLYLSTQINNLPPSHKSFIFINKWDVCMIGIGIFLWMTRREERTYVFPFFSNRCFIWLQMTITTYLYIAWILIVINNKNLKLAIRVKAEISKKQSSQPLENSCL